MGAAPVQADPVQVVKLTGKERQQVQRDLDDLRLALENCSKLVNRISSTFGRPDFALIHVRELLGKARQVVDQNVRGWVSIKNKREAAR
jgi:hypothetical protein